MGHCDTWCVWLLGKLVYGFSGMAEWFTDIQKLNLSISECHQQCHDFSPLVPWGFDGGVQRYPIYPQAEIPGSCVVWKTRDERKKGSWLDFWTFTAILNLATASSEWPLPPRADG